MAYWWVNQNQTFDEEIGGGYLWSPQRIKNGRHWPYYEFMRLVQPGDVILSFSKTYIRAVGIAKSFSYASPKPEEFGNIGLNWHPTEGWRVDVSWTVLQRKIRPKEHIAALNPLLPAKYAPLQSDGDGVQSVYLTTLSGELFGALARLVGPELTVFVGGFRDVNASALDISKAQEDAEAVLEDLESTRIITNSKLTETEREALVKSRLGQGQFKKNLSLVEKRCRITKVDRIEHLIAGHTKPWRKSTNDERLNGENGFLLTPTIDHLFDRGFISFEDTGEVIVSPVAHTESLRKMGLQPGERINVGSFTYGQKQFLDFHRENVLKVAKIKSVA